MPDWKDDPLVQNFIDPAGWSNREMASQQQKQEGQSETWAEFFVRRSIPFGSTAANLIFDAAYRRARDRFENGKATEGDIKLIAREDARQRREAEKGTGRSIGSGVARIPAMLGEAAIGGGIVGRIAGGVRVAPAIVPQIAAGTTRLAGQTALMPSMYMEDASRRSLENGGSLLSPKNIAPAFAHGAIMTAILGRLGKPVEGVPTMAGRLATRTAVGMAEQQGADTITSLVDEILPEAYQFKTEYGLLGKILKGKEGTAKEAAVQATTFAVFSALHAPGDAAKRRKVAMQELEAFNRRMKAELDKGATLDEAIQRAAKPAEAKLAAEGQPGTELKQAVEPTPSTENWWLEAAKPDQELTSAKKEPQPLPAPTPQPEAPASVPAAAPEGVSQVTAPPPPPEPPRIAETGRIPTPEPPVVPPEPPVVPPEPPVVPPEPPKPPKRSLVRKKPEVAPEATPEPAKAKRLTVSDFKIVDIGEAEDGKLRQYSIRRGGEERYQIAASSPEGARRLVERSLRSPETETGESRFKTIEGYSADDLGKRIDEAKISDRDKKILHLRLLGVPPTDIAKSFGISDARISQIQSKFTRQILNENTPTLDSFTADASRKGLTGEAAPKSREAVSREPSPLEQVAGADPHEIMREAEAIQQQVDQLKESRKAEDKAKRAALQLEADRLQEQATQIARDEQLRETAEAIIYASPEQRAKLEQAAEEAQRVAEGQKTAEPSEKPRLTLQDRLRRNRRSGTLTLPFTRDDLIAGYRRTRGYIREIKDEFARLAGRKMPSAHRYSPDAATAGARYDAAANGAGRAMGEYIADRVGLGKKVPEEIRRRIAAAWHEIRFRTARRQSLAAAMQASQKRANAAAQGDNAGAQRWADEATRLMNVAKDQTLVGTEFATEAEFQAYIRAPEFTNFMKKYEKYAKDPAEQYFRMSQGLKETDPIEQTTQIPNAPFTAIPMDHAEKGAGRVSSRGSLTAQALSTLGASREAALVSDAYLLDARESIIRMFETRVTNGTKAELYRQYEKAGLGRWENSQSQIDGFEKIPEVKPPRGTQQAEPGQKAFFIQKDVANEFKKLLGINHQPYTERMPLLKPLSALSAWATKINLMSAAEAVSHMKNQLTFLVKPGVLERLPLAFIEAAFKTERFQRDLLEVTMIGANKSYRGHEAGNLIPEAIIKKFPRMKYFDPTWYMGRLLDLTSDVTRVAGSRAFDSLAKRPDWLGGVENTGINKADFINQLGNYSKRTQSEMVVFLRESGINPFATATTNYIAQAYKALYGGTGVKARSWKGQLALSAEQTARTVAVAAIVPLVNYLLWGNVFGDDSVPVGGIKIGTDENGRSRFVDLMAFTGITRGLRQSGALAVAEDARRGTLGHATTPRALKQALQSHLHVAGGPAVQAVDTLLTGENAFGHDVRREEQQGDFYGQRNVEAMLKQLNPAVHAMLDEGDRPKSEFEKGMGMLGPFGIKTAQHRGSMAVQDIRRWRTQWQRDQGILDEPLRLRSGIAKMREAAAVNDAEAFAEAKKEYLDKAKAKRRTKAEIYDSLKQSLDSMDPIQGNGSIEEARRFYSSLTEEQKERARIATEHVKAVRQRFLELWRTTESPR